MNRSKSVCFALIAMYLIFSCAESALAGSEGDPVAQREIRVIARQFEFEPRQITVRKGEAVRLVVTSEDVAHGLAIREFGIDQRIDAKQTRVIEFTPTREGRFRMKCSVSCGDGHADMDGELIVTAAESSMSQAAPSNIQVKFDENTPGVVIVESHGERVRIDTSTKTVARLSESAPLTQRDAEKTPDPAVPLKTRESSKAYEPYDYRLINVPTPKRVPRNSFNVHFTHRFQQPFRQDDVPVREELEGLFGLDSFSVSSLGFSYGITERLYANFYRSPICQQGICKTIELGLGYHFLDEAGRSPVALSAYASIEGEDNFTEEFTYNIQAMVARSVTRYVNVFFSPAVHINSNGQGRFNPTLGEFFPLDPAAADFELGQHTGSFGFGVNARIRPTTSLLFEYVPRIGFKLGQVEADFDPTFTRITRFTNKSEASLGFGIEKRIGRHSFALTFSNTQGTTTSRYNSSNLALPPSRFSIGFNLFRRLY